MKPQLKADLAMLLVTLFWGSSYLFMQMGLTDLQTFNFIALRFLLAFVLAGLFFRRRILRTHRKTLGKTFVLGTLLFGVFVTITTGLKTTTASQAGFLVSLTVIFVPFLSMLLRQIPPPRVFLGAFLALIGIGLLTLNSQLEISRGDLLCILGAVFYAIHIIVTGRWANQSDPLQLGVYQLGFTGLLGLLFSLALETPRLPVTPEAWFAVLMLGIFCSAVGFVVQTVAQQYTTPTHTALIFSMEPVLAVAIAFLVTGEMLSLRGYVGAALVLFSILIAEMDLGKWLRRKSSKKLAVTEKNVQA
ncbi:DMT family transporter [Brevibacillus invocatus]|uniref:DMT family transporter n=1 Tax=Brevibacillus invocatus TaxID=173959 RepID=A0A3M8C9Q4_9BACL|nr:DMT family transporter [Brevibacillus invocatus]RNB72223.1 DMT family transporter [Brevibacillus invocatus]